MDEVAFDVTIDDVSNISGFFRTFLVFFHQNRAAFSFDVYDLLDAEYNKRI